MDNKSVHMVTQATERLFQAAQAAVGTTTEARICERLMRAFWRQLVALSGPDSAAALLGQALVEASSRWPLAGLVRVTSEGIDATALRQACNPADCCHLREACRSVVQKCLSIVVTLSGEELALAFVERVEAELLELKAEYEASHGPE